MLFLTFSVLFGVTRCPNQDGNITRVFGTAGAAALAP